MCVSGLGMSRRQTAGVSVEWATMGHTGGPRQPSPTNHRLATSAVVHGACPRQHMLETARGFCTGQPRLPRGGGHETKSCMACLLTTCAKHVGGDVATKRESCACLHMAVFPSPSWCAECTAWTQDHLQSARTMQLRMSRRALRLWKRAGEEWQEYLARCTHYVEKYEAHLGVPRWVWFWRHVDGVLLATWSDKCTPFHVVCFFQLSHGAMRGGARP